MLNFKNQPSKEKPASVTPTSVTTIGAETKIEGVLRGDDSLAIHGKIEGDIFGNNDVTIGQQGTVAGSITCKNLTVSGKIIGNVQVDGILHIHARGELQGDVTVYGLVVDEMGIFNGNCKMKDMNSLQEPIDITEKTESKSVKASL